MYTLRQFIRQQQAHPKGKRGPPGGVGLTPVPKPVAVRGNPHYQAAKHLARLFLAFKRALHGADRWSLAHEGKGAFTAFLELAEWLAQLRAWRIEVSKIEYLRAHFAEYGSACTPQHLISDWSWALYVRYRLAQRAGVVVGAQQDQDRDIEAIQHAQGCSRAVARAAYRAVMGGG